MSETKTATITGSISPGGYMENKSINCAVSGWTPRLAGSVWLTGTGTSFALFYATRLDGTTVKYSVRNMSSSVTMSPTTVYVRVLYSRN